MRNFCYIVPYKGCKICSFLRTQTCLNSQKMDEHCNYKYIKYLASFPRESDKFIKMQSVSTAFCRLSAGPAVPAWGLPAHAGNCGCPAHTVHAQSVSTAPQTQPKCGQQCRSCAARVVAGKDAGKLNVSRRNKWPMNE